LQPQPKKQKSLKELWHSGPGGKCGVIAVAFIVLLVVGTCSGIMNAVISGSQSAATLPTPTTQVVATQQPTPSPTATPKPKPTTTPTDTDVTTLDKNGSTGMGTDVHFTSTILNFVKDSSGVTAGANLSDSGSSSVIQVLFTPGSDIAQLNQDDTLEIWGTNLGSSTGTNAFGGTIQEVGVQAKYMYDKTTGYKADS